MNGDTQFVHASGRIQRIALTGGVLGLAASAALSFLNPAQFFRSYLVAYLLWSGITFGSLAALMVHHLAGGGWGYLIRRPLEAATRTWPLIAVLFLPLLAGLPNVYEWSHQAAAGKYLNVPFFTMRAILYFAVLGTLIYMLNRISSRQDESDDPALLRRLQNLSGPGLVLYAVLVSFALVDWAMSIEPDWYSTIFPAIWLMGQILSALAFAAAFLVLLAKREPLSQLATPKYLNDLGNMMLAFTMLWAYMQFGQLLIIWSGNLTEEIPWFIHRVAGSWSYMTVALAIFHFAAPFVLLLSRSLKRDIRSLSKIAVAIVVFRLLDAIWTVQPTFDRNGYRLHLLDLLLPLSLGAIWTAAYLRQLRRQPLLPLKDPRLSLVIQRIEHPRVGDIVYGSHAAGTHTS